MAKKKTASKKRRKRASEATSDAPGTVTYSTRLTREQRELIEQAADLAGCKAAKFMRDAAVQRAAEVVNLRDNAAALRRLADVVAKQMLDPEAELEWADDDGERLQREPARYSDSKRLPQANHPDNPDGRRLLPQRPSDEELAQIRQALQTCSAEFARIVAEAWRFDRLEAKRYEPAVSAADLLKGGDA